MRKPRIESSHRIASEALRTAGTIGSMVRQAQGDTSEMRNLLTTLLAAEENVALLARRFVSSR